MTSLEKLKVLLYEETKDEFGRTNFPQRLEIAKELEKELKALEIIKNKRVLTGMVMSAKDLWGYNNYVSYDMELTQEEYDLIKEVML